MRRILALMRYREFAPGGAASEFVDCYWVLEVPRPGAVQRVVPDGRPELILNLGQPFESLRDGAWQAQPQCFLAGQLTRPAAAARGRRPRILGVRFRPGGAGSIARHSGAGTDGPCGPGSPISACRELAGLSTLRDVERALLAFERGAEDALVDEAARLLSALARCRRRRGATRRQSAPTGAALQGTGRNVAQTLRAHPPLSARLPCDGRWKRDGWTRRPPADTTTRPT